MYRSVPSKSNVLLSSALTLALAGVTEVALAQATTTKPQDSAPSMTAPAKDGTVTDSAQPVAPAQDQAAATEAQAAAPQAPAPVQEPTKVVAPAATPAPGPSAIMATTSPVVPLDVREKEIAQSSSWFARTPISTMIGSGPKRLVLTLYGFVNTTAIHDSTRSYGESMGAGLVARPDTYAGRTGRTQFTPRGTRLGLMLQLPSMEGIRPTAVITYGVGPQPNTPPTATESTYYDSPTLGIYQAYVNLQSDYVDVLGGLTYGLFGWQNYYYPCSVAYFGMPNQVFNRATQFRLSHMFGDATGPISVEAAVAANRPVQRDSEIPDTNAGLRFAVNGWKGISTPGSSKTMALPASIGVSGIMREFKVNAFAPPPAQSSNSVKGWGVSIDAFLPVIPAKDDYDRGNRLTLTGSFVTGAGIGDIMNVKGGAGFLTLPNPALAQPPPTYTANVDPGLVTFDLTGVLHAIKWQSFMVGFQYYLPPTGRLFLAANYTHAKSDNIADFFPVGRTEVGLLTFIANQSDYYDANLFWDATPALRVGASFQYSQMQYIDGPKPHNYREMLSMSYAWGADPIYPL